jgi:hypothetical protein
MQKAEAKRKMQLLNRSLGFFREHTRTDRNKKETPRKGLRGSKPAALWSVRARGKKAASQDEDKRDDSPIALDPTAEAILRTRILTVTNEGEKEHFVGEEPSTHSVQRSLECCAGATEILQHSYLDLLCAPADAVDDSVYRRKFLSDDPTVQESIECIFASQLEEGLPYMLLADNDDDESDAAIESEENDILSPPSPLQQSILRNRSDSSLHKSPRPAKPRKLRVHGSLVHVGTCDPSKSDDATADLVPTPSSTAVRCACCRQYSPVLSPDRWPQRPILLRPTPRSGTRIKGVRFSGSSDYIWASRKSTLSWPRSLRAHWGMPDVSDEPGDRLDLMCNECMILPINNGNEPPGEALVVDFETDLFDGTLLVRVRETEGTTSKPYDDSKGYFAGMNRRYQVVVRGKFKKEIPLTECVTGFELERPCGKLPPKWIVKGAIKVIGFFAPQLQARLDGDRPLSLTPLGSTPQCIIVQDEKSELDLEHNHEEPDIDSATLLLRASNAISSIQRARYRKKAFDRLYADKSPLPMTDRTKIYTFEFLQHLFNFKDFSIELGSMMGSIQLKEVLDGQPLQVMASHFEKRLWSFDVWHEVLVDDAVKYDKL